jgi:hypothetical protein
VFGIDPVVNGPDTLNTNVLAFELSGTPHWTVTQSAAPALPLWRPELLVDSPRDRLLAFGAFGQAPNPRTLWALPLEGTGTWQEVAVTDSLPNLPGTDEVSLALDPVGNRLLLYSDYFRPGDPGTRSGSFNSLSIRVPAGAGSATRGAIRAR